MMEIKNAIIIDGHLYLAKRTLFGPFLPDVCDKCDLKKRCDKNQNCFCAPFEKKGYVPYFKKFIRNLVNPMIGKEEVELR